MICNNETSVFPTFLQILKPMWKARNICKVIQWNLDLSFPDNSFSWICHLISMVPEWILFKLWLPHLLFSRVHCFFFRPLTKTMNRGFTVIVQVNDPYLCTVFISIEFVRFKRIVLHHCSVSKHWHVKSVLCRICMYVCGLSQYQILGA
jgi:hypothetical protein